MKQDQKGGIMANISNPKVTKIVSKHLQNWEIRRNIEQRQHMTRGNVQMIGPYITISRLPYCSGTEVARQVADEMGWEFFDKDIVDHIAADANTLTNFVTSLDEKCRKSMDDYIQTTIDVNSLGHMAYLRHLKRVIMTLAIHGRVVILGRGANFILPRKRGLRVKLTSKLQNRVQRLMEAEQLTRSVAESQIKQLDKQHSKFLTTHFNIDASDITQNLDMILNMDSMTIGQASTIIASSARKLKPLQPQSLHAGA
ncbi:MAG: cytidylate kinase-like family protein [bacterium]|nr:cytidylate kinase-like family protein [bacterium]